MGCGSRDGTATGPSHVERHRAGLARVATAVAASSAFPAFFPPLELRAEDVGASEGEFSTQYFTDGGIFDNLGVRMFQYLSGEDSLAGESLQLREGACDVVLASDVGRVFAVYGSERTPGFLSTALRSSDILMNRVWQLERDHFAHARQCVFAASSDIVPQESDSAALHPEIQVQVSRIRTDMDRFRKIEISGLIRHGYCVARQACRSLPPELSDQIREGPPWDPTVRQDADPAESDSASDRRQVDNVTTAARLLQRSSRRRLWSSLVDFRDWITWIYVPLFLLLLVVLPLFAYRTYRHARLDAALTRAVAEMREDFRRMLGLLEFGPPAEFPVDGIRTGGPPGTAAGRRGAGYHQRHPDYRLAGMVRRRRRTAAAGLRVPARDGPQAVRRHRRFQDCDYSRFGMHPTLPSAATTRT